MADGVTIYYASDGEGLGGYDIFVTRYNTNTDTYLVPENVGMPFNSPYNDYMYVIDDSIIWDGLLPTVTSRKGKYVSTFSFPIVQNKLTTTRLWNKNRLSAWLKSTH